MSEDYSHLISSTLKDNYQETWQAKRGQIQSAYIAHSELDFMCFARGLVIDSATGPCVFENCMAMFQRQCFEELAVSLHDLREGRMPTHSRWWIERTKKAGKDSDLAVILTWLLAFPHRPIYLQVGAADREQAAIVKERIVRLLHWNEWLTDKMDLIQWGAKSKAVLANGAPMAHLDIMSSDIAGAHGGTPDLLVINELSHVTRWEFAENLMDNADGVAQGMVIIATNAGVRGTKAETWRNNAITSDRWMVHCWSHPAPWHSQATVDDAKRRNTHSRFLRLWRGKWVSGKGDALSEESIDRCFCLPGPTLAIEKGWEYVAGLDLGVSHDHSGLVVLGVNREKQKIKTVWWKVWIPKQDGRIDLTDVENACLIANQMYHLRYLYYDPHQAELMSQRLIRRQVPVREMTFGRPSNLTAMAVGLIQIVEEDKLECYDDEDGRLRSDFGKFNIVEKSYGYKLEAVSDESGHADVGTALAICLPAAMELLGMSGYLTADDVLYDPEDDNPMTPEEVKEMSPELREIYEMDFEKDSREYSRKDDY